MNKKHSEALECLERIDNTLCLNNNKGNLEFGIDTEEHIDCDNAIDMVEDLETIKQYILKAQKQKNYLKWEDLKTNTEGGVDLEVSLNGTKYMLSYFPSDTFKVLTNDEGFYLEIENKQFFNDLHLERVLE